MIEIGNNLELEAFRKRHSRFLELSDSLVVADCLAFVRELHSTRDADTAIFYLGIRCSDDFRSILALAGNGAGLVAKSILRGMYERAVTAEYLRTNPDAAADFIDFDELQRYRLLSAIKQTHGVTDARLDEAIRIGAERAEVVRKRFEITACKKCGAKRQNHTWSKLDFVTMCSQVGDVGKLVIQAYYEPMSQSHSTLRSISSQLELVDGEVRFRQTQHTEADSSLRFAHLVLLAVLGTNDLQFGPTGLAEALVQANADYATIWGEESVQAG